MPAVSDRLADKVALVTGSGRASAARWRCASPGGRDRGHQRRRCHGRREDRGRDRRPGHVRGRRRRRRCAGETYFNDRATHGRLDVSVHNAGVMDPRDEAGREHPLEVWDRVISDQPHRRVSVLPPCRAADGGHTGQQLADQHRLVRRSDGGSLAPDRLHGEQGRGAIDDARDRGAVRTPRTPSQCHLPRSDEDATARST